MKLVKQSIDNRTLSGSVTLLPTDPEDMWSCYNLLAPKDKLRASAVRRVAITSSTGSTHSERVHTTLTLSIVSLDFDPMASQLHVNGRVVEQNEYVRLGQHHTLDLELNRNFTLTKDEGWDSVAQQMLHTATKEEDKSQLWSLLIEEGLAHICVVTSGTTTVRQTVTSNLGSKGSPGYSSALGKFYTKTLNTLLRALDPENLKPLLVAGPGFVPAAFVSNLKATLAGSQTKGKSAADAKLLKKVLDLIIMERCANASPSGLAGLLTSPALQRRIADTAFGRESRAVDALFERMRKDDGRVVYGPAETEAAVEAGAVGKGGGTLLILDELFRSMEIGVRKRFVALVDRVGKTEGGDVMVLSSAHESGARLKTVGGVAALLTFPLFETDEDEQAPTAQQETTTQAQTEEQLPEIEM